MKINIIDLFCGVGGLTHGFIKEGFNVVGGIDIDESCKYAYEINNKGAIFINKDVSQTTADDINKLFGKCDIKILAGCAPCQPFSSYSYKTNDENKWRLLYEFKRLIVETNPHIVSMENVPSLMLFKKAPVFADFLESLENLGYSVSYEVVNCTNYGIPQSRKRLVLLASRLGKIKLLPPPKKIKHKTVKETIGKLPPINHGESSSSDFIHRANKLSPINLKRVMAAKPGGSWKDWNSELVLKCHKKSSGKSYVSVYGRMEWDKPSPTITTHCTGLGNGRFGHPEQNRAISLREAALLQTFPKSYKFVKRKEDLKVRQLAIHIGNAVPPDLGRVIAKSINEHMKKLKSNI